MTRPRTGQALTVAERQRRFRQAQMERKRSLEAQVRASEVRLGQYSTAQLGEQIAVMSDRWNAEHKSVRDRVLVLARRLKVI